MLSQKIQIKLGIYKDEEMTDTRHSWFVYRNREKFSKQKVLTDERVKEILNLFD
jgi:hypothetical protein